MSHPVPTRLKLLRGNPGHQKLNKNEPQPTIPPEPPEPPAFLVPAAKDEWWRTAPELWRLGMLTVLDIAVFGAYCQSCGRWQQVEELLAQQAERDPETGALLIKSSTGSLMQNPLLHVAARAAASMIRFGAEFGMGPAARSRVAGSFAAQMAPSKFGNLIAPR
jgi:P27 family predicted phage terminase small subunit